MKEHKPTATNLPTELWTNFRKGIDELLAGDQKLIDWAREGNFLRPSILEHIKQRRLL